MFEAVINFIKEQYPGKDPIPLHEPCFQGNEKKYLEECIDSTFVSSVGKFVNAFENKVAEYTGANRAVVITNGTEALYLSLKLVGVGPDDEVITQPLTFVATVNSVIHCGAVPVFVDVDRETLGLSPDGLLRFLKQNATVKSDFCVNKTSNRKIKACVPMHTFGHPCSINKIIEICNEWKITVIEDAAESIGSFYNSKHTGTFGKLGVLSFNGNKTITTGGGGMILTNDDELANLARHLSTQAKIPHPWEYIHDMSGYNLRMPNLNAALGLAQMEQIEEFVQKKRALAIKYSAFFDSLNINFFHEPEFCRSNYWLNSIFLKNKKERDLFLRISNASGVMTRPSWRLMNKLPMFDNCQAGDLSNAEWIESCLVNIPSSAS